MKRFTRLAWRRAPVEAASVEIRRISVCGVSHTRAHRVRLVPITLPLVRGTGDTDTTRPWRMDALREGGVTL